MLCELCFATCIGCFIVWAMDSLGFGFRSDLRMTWSFLVARGLI